MTTLLNANTTAEGLSADNVLAELRAMGGKLALIRDSGKLVAMCADPAVQIQTIFRAAGDQNVSQDAAQFVISRVNAAPPATYIHGLNEVGFSAAHDTFNRTAALATEASGKKLVAYNAATNQSLASWQSAQSTIEWLVGRGHKIGIHLYLDGLHDAGGLAPLDWLLSIGVVPFVTEFGYIVSIFDAYTGWRKGLGNDPARLNAWLDSKMPPFAAKGAPLFMFSESPWPTDDIGKQNGFGFGDHPEALTHCAALNVQYPLGGTPVSPIPAPVPQLTSATVTATADPSGANIRASFTTSSAILGKLHVGDPVMYSHMAIQGGVYSVGSAIRHDWLALGQGYVAAGVITLKDVPSTPAKPAPAEIIDVSEAQGVIDWKTVAAAGVRTAFIRATQGLATVDKQFVANVTGARTAGLKVGLYHAYLPNDNADIQASNFLKAVAPYRFKLTYPLIVDVERQNGMTPTQVADGLLTLLTVLDGATGQKSWIYTAEGPWNAYVGAQHDAVFSQHTLWVANYTSASKPAMPRCWGEGNWVFWQYANNGKVAGIDEKHNVDLDRAHA